LKSTIKLIAPLLLIFNLNTIHADEFDKKNRELKRINNRITRLKQRLSDAKDKRETLEYELKKIDRKINRYTNTIYTLRAQINAKQKSIDSLDEQISSLNQQLKEQTDSLSEQLTTTYMLGKHQGLRLLLNQQSPNSISRYLSYYAYINEYRSKLIKDVLSTKHQIQEKESSMKHELENKRQLQASITEKKQHLIKDQHYQQQVIESLDKQISRNSKNLNQYLKDKERLEAIITGFEVKQAKPLIYENFSSMKNRLPWPTQGKVINLYGNKELINQSVSNGVTILAPEGQKVSAVFPGKVVFADWLRGYGLLIIVDHGNGYMTLYAHNQTLFKSSGDSVTQGETIALVGHSGGFRQNSLYFEIRSNGKPSNPLHWLV
jgi:septal ring factor EnvC (AmiA/AmiB activator)